MKHPAQVDALGIMSLVGSSGERSDEGVFARKICRIAPMFDGGAGVVGLHGCAFTGIRNDTPSRLNAFIAAIAIVRSTKSFGAKAAEAAA